MKNCEKCGAEIGDQYKYCKPCSDKMKSELKEQGGDIVKAISAVNNNLFFIRRYLEIQLAAKKQSLVWNKEKKDFELVKK